MNFFKRYTNVMIDCEGEEKKKKKGKKVIA